MRGAGGASRLSRRPAVERRRGPCDPLPMVRVRSASLTVIIAALMSACGAGDALPPAWVEPPARCEPADAYLAELYAAVDAGVADGLADVLRDRLSDDARSDFIDALLRLLRAFEPGAISALAPTVDEALSPPEGDAAPSALALVGRLLRFLEGPPAREDVFALGRRVLETCEGGPIFGVFADLLSDTAFVDAALNLLASPGLTETLAGLDFEGSEGREAMRYLVRNVLAAATQESFSLETLTGILGLLVDLDTPPWDALQAGLETVLAGEGLVATRELLACVGRVDTDLVLGGFLYDLLVSDVLDGAASLIPAAGDGETERPLLRVLTQALAWLEEDSITRRGFAGALVVMLRPENAAPALGGAAALIEAGAIDGVLELVLDLVSGACRR